MQFNPLGFMLATAMTSDLRDRGRAAQIGVLGGALGPSPAGAVLLAVAAREGRLGPGPVATLPSVGEIAPAMVQVPELPDDPDEARKVIESRGLVATTSEVTSGEPIGVVISSDPKFGSVVRAGSTVTILVSAGLEVPNVVGKEYWDAESTLRTAGFEDIECAESEKSGAENVVDSQEPEGGSFADARSTVTLYLFRPKPRLSTAKSSAEE